VGICGLCAALIVCVQFSKVAPVNPADPIFCNLPSNFLAKIQKKYSSIEKNLSKKTARYLDKMERQEKKLQRKALKADSGYVRHENIDS